MADQLDWFNIVIARREAKKGRGTLSKKTPPITTSAHPQTAAPPTATPMATPTASADVKSKDGTKGVASQEDRHEAKEKETKKKKKGLFANFRKKFKSGGKSEEVKVKKEGEGERVSGSAVERREKKGKEEEKEEEEEREERERQEFYKAIGYSEDEDFVEFPREVSRSCVFACTTCALLLLNAAYSCLIISCACIYMYMYVYMLLMLVCSFHGMGGSSFLSVCVVCGSQGRSEA